MVYDYFITFDLEVSEIWQKRMTGAKILFFLNRYLFLIAQFLTVLFTLIPRLDSSVSFLLLPSSQVTSILC